MTFLIDKQQNGIHSRDNDDMTPLHMAALGGHKKILHYLLSKGADLEAKDNAGRTVLILLCTNWESVGTDQFKTNEDQQLDTIKWLCTNYDINLLAQDNCGFTPIMTALDSGQHDIVNYLAYLMEQQNIEKPIESAKNQLDKILCEIINWNKSYKAESEEEIV